MHVGSISRCRHESDGPCPHAEPRLFGQSYLHGEGSRMQVDTASRPSGVMFTARLSAYADDARQQRTSCPLQQMERPLAGRGPRLRTDSPIPPRNRSRRQRGFQSAHSRLRKGATHSGGHTGLRQAQEQVPRSALSRTSVVSALPNERKRLARPATASTCHDWRVGACSLTHEDGKSSPTLLPSGSTWQCSASANPPPSRPHDPPCETPPRLTA